MPLYYQLERTHVRVAEKPAVITKRLSHCLREESMHAIYHEDEVRYEIAEEGDFLKVVRVEDPSHDSTRSGGGRTVPVYFGA